VIAFVAGVVAAVGMTIGGTAPAAFAAGPSGWPAGSWPVCSGPSDQYCLDTAEVTPLGGVATPVTGLGLSPYLTTLPSGGGPTSVNLAVNGWDGAGVTDATRAGTVNFVFRVGQFAPRYRRRPPTTGTP